ncbi:TPA: conjugal transfer protein TrbD [Legionella pneumophila]|uniref:conjugal transfer protein TrbD n=1 Tax=Legionella pneumophila TaxID=446 RepID=UPI0007709295|nr:conjugal transfer protein TrbD [Legionella pneumophila]MDW8902198.1 conjugal transfer protein TrbD [Legionella pneumophila]MDW8908264.1 conjugal transfer protein TrbD [Legionella pneumophila]RYX29137.1 conjugal transfer protein TrbD [Legionella pneumophila]CZP17699.1 conjugal transfer protein TrbD [Legionella pneumophila]HAT1765753.1 conjugal transfer protein TrbD [Legionella pneumophila]
MSLRSIPIRKCGNRPNLFMGGDRELVMFSGLLSAILVFAAQDGLAALCGIALWFLSLKGLRMMAKSDPFMRAVYLRQRSYQAYYPARSTPFRNNARGYV